MGAVESSCCGTHDSAEEKQWEVSEPPRTPYRQSINENTGAGPSVERSAPPGRDAGALPRYTQYLRDAGQMDTKPPTRAQGPRISVKSSVEPTFKVEPYKIVEDDIPMEPEKPQEPEKPPDIVLLSPIYLVGNWSEWKIEKLKVKGVDVDGQLEQIFEGPEGAPPCRADMARLKKTLKLTSASFSCQVVNKDLQWKWRLYPDKANKFWGTHVSKEGVMKDGVRDKCTVAIGDEKKGHSLNFHAVEYANDVVTIYLDVPTKPKGKAECMLDNATDFKDGRQPRIWYIKEDKNNPSSFSVGLTAGDGFDVEKYRSKLKDA